MERIFAAIPASLWTLGAIALALTAALVTHQLVLSIAHRAALKSSTRIDDILLRRLRSPVRWLLVAFALTAVQSGLALSASELAAWSRVAGLVFPALIGWLAIALLGIVIDIVKELAKRDPPENLRAGRHRTRVGILHRIGVFFILLATFCMMLLSIPSVRDIGVTLIASAGLAALAVGAAAQPALKNLIAGLRMAFTEPITIDDDVVVEGEWGRIEEIQLTYVIVRTWDERRLVVPVSKFLDDSFQNWTRTTSQMLGSVMWHLDPTTDVPRLRVELERLVRKNERWDGRFFNLQVIDARPEAIEVRALMSAKDASSAFDLRCDVREAMLAFITREMPEAIVRYRSEFGLGRVKPEPI